MRADDTTSGRIEFAASVICLDLLELGVALGRLEAAGIDALHLDFIDGDFAPNLGLPLELIPRLRRVTKLPLRAHLMTRHPARYASTLRDAGVASVSVPLIRVDEWRALREALGGEIALGLALGATQQIHDEALRELRPERITVLCVRPGFPGQPFIPSAVRTVTRARAQCLEADIRASFEADGAIGPNTIGPLARAGCQSFVLGSTVLSEGWDAAAFTELRKLAQAQASIGHVAA